MIRSRTKVTLITPTYNQCEFLPATIDSVLAQTYRNIDYVVVDDGSIDDTSKVLSEYQDALTVKSQENIGQVRTLNNEWLNSDAEFIAYLSSDDLLDPRAVEVCVTYLQSHPTCVCVFPNADLINSHGKVIKKGVCREFVLEKTIVEQECYIGPGAVFRRDAFLRVGPWNPLLKLAPDREFWIRLSQAGSVDFIKETFAQYRMHSDSLSFSDKSAETAMEYISVLDDLFLSSGHSISHLKQPSYQAAYLLVARNCFLGGETRRGFNYILKSMKLGIGFLFFKKILSLLRVLTARLYWKLKA